MLSPRLDRKTFSFGSFKINSQVANFFSHLITPCHSLSHLPPRLENHFHLTTLNTSQAPDVYHIFSRLFTPYHTLSSRLKEKHFHLVTLKLVAKLQFYTQLITFCHSLSHLISKVGKKTIFMSQL